MRLADLGTRPVRTTLAVTAVALLLGGCGGQVTASPAVTSVEAKPPAASSSPSPSSPAEEPSLPPGDPGLDAPSVPDPGTASAEPHGHEGHARRTVPTEAMLTAGTVRMVLGGRWERRPGGGDECVRPEGALGVRDMSYGGAVEGLVVETVATYEDADAADEAVADLGRAAAACGWTAGRDPRLGSASVAATNGAQALVAVSTEGVAVLLVGTGDFTRDRMRWGSLVDLALGTSCPAAPDGCH